MFRTSVPPISRLLVRPPSTSSTSPSQVPCTPDRQADGTGRIGVQIFSNAIVDHVKARDVPDAFSIASAEFARYGRPVFMRGDRRV